MRLNIAFIGYNAVQTRMALHDFVRVNADQVAIYNSHQGVVKLKDGTTILGIFQPPEFLDGLRFDQAIVADDRRRQVSAHRGPVLLALDRCMAHSTVPGEFRWLFYDLDAEDEEAVTDEGL